MGDDMTGGPRSRRDRGMTALIEGVFGFVWFGWGQANASVRAPCRARRGRRRGPARGRRRWGPGVPQPRVHRCPPRPASPAPLRCRRRGEFSLAGVGAAVLAVAGQGDFIPVRVCAVVGVHFFPLASLLEDRLLVALGVSLTTVALVALVAGLVTDVAPSTVTGIGAGTLLTVFGLAALAGVPAEGTSQLSSPRQREG
jgi:hypothetical protein